ncbi:AraC-like DNA-binding protein [Brevundimonas alba]|uniref:AraC-like DNA-binding protein n=1 Tax=Brevundimonas alba TaxID=74314 RepID=A0A7X5YMQ0_9CAUL|nr:helix-turn-helix domain-containing protein [Brevundimonas alba]NJC41469.1 AraC-like DNA-binding protein [Brevundimonas alba]
MEGADLYLGWRTALLGLATLQILLLAVALLVETGNRVANRTLAALLAVLAGLLIPYAIGFAGFYDAFRWLTFAPFAIPLAVGPLLYGYAASLADGRLPPRWRAHLAPPVLQLAWFALCFLLPADLKWDWYTGGHRTFVAPLFQAMEIVSLAAYAFALRGVLRRQRTRLADQRSDDDRFSARWLGRLQAAILIGLVTQTGFWLWSLITGGIDFFQETGLYLALAALGLYLGVAGWRHGALPVPLPAPLPPVVAEPPTSSPPPDWAVVATDVDHRVREAGWWREPDLTLPRLSRLLGTNTGRLSRALNLGLGVNFSTFVNGLRAEGVAGALRADPDADLLDLAFDMGFASKASFNRAFKSRFGMAPSQYRRSVSDHDFADPEAKLRRVAL